MARIARKHNLEHARVAHVALNELIDVAHAERPVRHAHWQTVHRDLHHEGIGDGLEVDRVKRQSRPSGKLFDLLNVALPIAAAHTDPSSALCSEL